MVALALDLGNSREGRSVSETGDGSATSASILHSFCSLISIRPVNMFAAVMNEDLMCKFSGKREIVFIFFQMRIDLNLSIHFLVIEGETNTLSISCLYPAF